MPTSLQIHRINPSKPGNVACSRATGFQKKPQMAAELLALPSRIAMHHVHETGHGQCGSMLVQSILAPLSTVWSVVRRFDNPQAYKNFLKSCHVIDGDGKVGSVREVHVVSGLPASSSTERLDILDDEHHVIGFSIVGGEHRLSNYRSVTTLHPAPVEGDKAGGTVVVESYVVDVPAGNTKEDTCMFLDTIVRCNLQSLARISEKLANMCNYQH